MESEFLCQFAPRSLGGALVRFDVAARDVPTILLGRLDHEDTSLVVLEEDAGRDAGACHGDRIGRLSHAPEGRASGDSKALGQRVELGVPGWGAAHPPQGQLPGNEVVLDLLGASRSACSTAARPSSSRPLMA